MDEIKFLCGGDRMSIIGIGTEIGTQIAEAAQVLRFLKSDDLLYILKKIAYWAHTQGGTPIDKDELLRQLQQEIQTLKKCEPHEAQAEAERFIDFSQKRTGLLNEQERERYTFAHKTFQEYLTAEEIFDCRWHAARTWLNRGCAINLWGWVGLVEISGTNQIKMA